MREGGWRGAALAASLLLQAPPPPLRAIPDVGRPVGPPPHRRAPSPPAEGEIVVAILTKPDLGEAGYDLFTMNLDGTNRRQITNDDKQEFLPHFSPPDGKRLIFTRFVTGSYSVPGAETHVVLYDFAARSETDLGEGRQPVWSPDGSRLAFLSRRFGKDALCVMNADGSDAHVIARPSGDDTDQQWGDLAWSIEDWILLTVGEDRGGSCFKVRLDKFRPDGTERTQVTDGGPNCTPPGKEQSGDADPGFSADGRTIFTSRGYPNPPAGGIPAMTERRLVGVSAGAWSPGKPESDLSLPAFPSCIEGVPKGSPDGRRVLLFRACPAQGAGGMALTDGGGTFRRFLGDGFGADWHPLADSHAARDARATRREYPTVSGSASGAQFAAFDAEWRLTEARAPLVSLSFRLRASVAGGSGPLLALLLYNFETSRFEKVLAENPSSSAFLTQEIELGDLRYVQPGDGTVRARVLATGAPEGGPFNLLVDQLQLETLAVR
jgi:WD40-like Beta Propeller Repeat